MARNLPPHPLEADGFLSIGCMPCTDRVGAAEDRRAGRWRGLAKDECGIHLASLRGAGELDMSDLDELESQSVFILREAFRKVGKLGLLWSIGKDSNVLVWLARKAFFGRVPFPVIHIDTSYKLPEMIAFRERMAREWGLDLIVGQNRAALADGMNHTRGRVACCSALKTDGLEGRAGAARLHRHHRRHPPRRGGHARQGARLQPARRERASGISAISRRNSGTTSTPICRPASICASIRCCIGPSSMSGATCGARAIPVVDLYFATRRQALPLAGRADVHRHHGEHGRDVDEIIAELEGTTHRRSAPGARRTRRPRTPSSACAPPATCEGTLASHEHRTRALPIVIVGHVDHGKSTLIGRLLHDTGALPEGKVAALQEASRKRGMPFEWSFVMDALKIERDQGITIDTTRIRFAQRRARLRHHRRAGPCRVPQEHDDRRRGGGSGDPRRRRRSRACRSRRGVTPSC